MNYATKSLLQFRPRSAQDGPRQRSCHPTLPAPLQRHHRLRCPSAVYTQINVTKAIVISFIITIMGASIPCSSVDCWRWNYSSCGGGIASYPCFTNTSTYSPDYEPLPSTNSFIMSRAPMRYRVEGAADPALVRRRHAHKNKDIR
ncbi:hypothetical protein CHUAL_003381 [Chamberlinius hualienensis]